jgi:hypothetical protein
MKEKLRGYFDYLITNRYIYNGDLLGDERQYLHDCMFNKIYDECMERKDDFDSGKYRNNNKIGRVTSEYSFHCSFMRNLLQDQIMVFRIKPGRKEDIMKPFRREKRMRKLLD